MDKETLKMLANKLMFTMNESEYDTLNEEFETILKGKKCLVCLARGTDYTKTKPKNHPIQPTTDEIIEALNENGDGFVKAMWCGDEECEDMVKEKTGVCSRCIPLESEAFSDVCVCCGKPAKHLVYWGKAY